MRVLPFAILVCLSSCSFDHKIVVTFTNNGPQFMVMKHTSSGLGYSNDICPTLIRVIDDESDEVQWEMDQRQDRLCLHNPLVYGRADRGASTTVSARPLKRNRQYRVIISVRGGNASGSFSI